jgi:IS605 OrfB family transposase
MKFTYQTRLNVDEDISYILGESAILLSQIERKLFAEIVKGKNPLDLKNEFLKKYKITARHFNSLRISIEGKIASFKEIRKDLIKKKKSKIKSLEKNIKNLIKKNKDKNIIHQKKRRLFNLKTKLQKLESDEKNNKIRICFGSKKLFNAQFNLKENGYENHKNWKKDWNLKRNNSFFLVGSKDENGGNLNCTAIICEDNSLTLRVRLPDGLKNDSKYIFIKNVKFKYGHEKILESIKANRAITYRFKKDEKGWRVFVSIDYFSPPIVTNKNDGAIGIDINADHIALAGIDRYGNIIDQETIPLVTYGKRKNQAKAIIGDVVTKVIKKALKVKKPIVLENLDFQKKKTILREKNKKYSRMLSSFSYKTIINFLNAKAFKNGIAIFFVHPAYTSVIGRVKFAKQYGLTIHISSAFCIARRALRLSENPPLSLENVPDGKGDHLTLSLPVRIRGKHVWSFWNGVSKKLKAELAAHFRAIKNRSSDPPFCRSLR